MDKNRLSSQREGTQEATSATESTASAVQVNGTAPSTAAPADSTSASGYPSGQSSAFPPQGQWPPPAGYAPPPAKKKNTVLVVAIVVALVVIVAGALAVFLLWRQPTREDNLLRTNYHVKIRPDETRLVCPDGTTQVLDIKPLSAVSNKDGSQVAYIDEEHILHLLDVKSGQEKTLAEDVFGLRGFELGQYLVFSRGELISELDALTSAVAEEMGITVEELLDGLEENDMDHTLENLQELYEYFAVDSFEFEATESTTFLYDLKKNAEKELFTSRSDENTMLRIRSSLNNEQLAYVDDDGSIRLLDANARETVVGEISAKASPYLMFIPDKGTMVVWQSTKAETVDVIAHLNGKETKVFSTTPEDYIFSEFNSEQDTVLLNAADLDAVYELKSNGEVNEIYVGGESTDIYCLTPGFGTAKNLDEFYISARNEDNTTLYFIDKSRNKFKVTDELPKYTLSMNVDAKPGHVYYLDDDDILFSVAVKGNQFEEPEKIASDVGTFIVSLDGHTVWYIKGQWDSGTLFQYTNGESEKIDEDCYLAQISPDGQDAVYFKNVDKVHGDKSANMGDLYLCHKGQITPIASKVVTYSINSHYKYSTYFNPYKFEFFQNSRYENGEIMGDLSKYDNGDVSLVEGNTIY